MIFGWNKNISKKVHRFQSEKISRNGLKQLFYNNQYQEMRIWGSTEGKTEGHPRRTLNGEKVFSIFGPRSGRPWSLMGTNEYIQGGYVILYDVNKEGFRVFPFNRITKVEFNDVTYEII